MTIKKTFIQLFDWFAPARKLKIEEGDSLPNRLPFRNIVLTQDDGEQWSVGMRCPCGCGTTIELLVIPEAKPRWDVEVNNHGLPTLKPSIWLNKGCRSHFWIREGKVIWCED